MMNSNYKTNYSNKKDFIAFQQERNHLGQLIQVNQDQEQIDSVNSSINEYNFMKKDQTDQLRYIKQLYSQNRRSQSQSQSENDYLKFADSDQMNILQKLYSDFRYKQRKQLIRDDGKVEDNIESRVFKYDQTEKGSGIYHYKSMGQTDYQQYQSVINSSKNDNSTMNKDKLFQIRNTIIDINRNTLNMLTNQTRFRSIGRMNQTYSKSQKTIDPKQTERQKIIKSKLYKVNNKIDIGTYEPNYKAIQNNSQLYFTIRKLPKQNSQLEPLNTKQNTKGVNLMSQVNMKKKNQVSQQPIEKEFNKIISEINQQVSDELNKKYKREGSQKDIVYGKVLDIDMDMLNNKMKLKYIQAKDIQHYSRFKAS